jgi:hypothetical protein
MAGLTPTLKNGGITVDCMDSLQMTRERQDGKNSPFKHILRDCAFGSVASVDSLLGPFRMLMLEGKVVEANHPYYVIEYDGGFLRTLELWSGRPSRFPLMPSRSTMYAFTVPSNRNGMTNSFVDYLLPLRYIEKEPSALLLGFGGGIIPRQWKDLYGIDVDSVEIDGRVIEMAGRFLPQTRELKVFNCDGAEYLRAAASSGKTYDIIIQDVSVWTGLPAQFRRGEFFEDARDALSSEGVLAIDYVTTPISVARYPDYVKKLGKEFNVFRIDAVNSINILLLGTSMDRDELLRKIDAGVPEEHKNSIPLKAYARMETVSQ